MLIVMFWLTKIKFTEGIPEMNLYRNMFLIIIITLFFSCSAVKEKEEDTTNSLIGLLAINAAFTLNLPTSASYIGTNKASTSGVFFLTVGNSMSATVNNATVNNATASFSQSSGVYTFPPGLTFDASTGNISGTPTTSNLYAINISVARYVPASNYRFGSGRDSINITFETFTGTPTQQDNVTCNSSGIAAGCNASTPYSCTSASLCYATYSVCHSGGGSSTRQCYR